MYGGGETNHRPAGRPVAVVTHRVTLIPGDGTGPELVQASRRVLEATGVAFEWDEQLLGMAAVQAVGTPLPDATCDSLADTRVGLKGPTTTSADPNLRSANVMLREAFDLYACIRPCRAMAGVRTRFPGTDVVVVRENLEDTYAGIEFPVGSPEAGKVRACLQALGTGVPADAGITIKTASLTGSERIAEAAFQYAATFGRRKVTAVHKANIMKATDGLFLDVAREVAARYPDIEFDERVVDALCAQLVSNPGAFDILLMPNFIGDVVSDLAAGLIGGLGLAPGMNLGPDVAVFEGSHGSAPRYAGKDVANPTALMLSGALMLRHLGEVDAADRLERAIAAVIQDGSRVTYDLKATTADPSAVGTAAYANEVVRELTQ